jgi:hypothetical protein
MASSLEIEKLVYLTANAARASGEYSGATE